MTPGIDPSMSPTPCRRFILSGQRTRSTEIPVMRSSLMACLRRSVMTAERVQGQDFILDGAIHTIRLQVSSSSEAVYGKRGSQTNRRRDRRRRGWGDFGEFPPAQGSWRHPAGPRQPRRGRLIRQCRVLQWIVRGADVHARHDSQGARLADRSIGPLVVRWHYLPVLAPWLLRFIRAGTKEKVDRRARALRTLVDQGIETMAPIA